MKKSVKVLAAIAAGLLSVQATAFAEFSDMPEGEYGTALQAAVDNGLITGYDDGTIKPDGCITRAEMATIIVRAMGATAKSSAAFPDVAANAWYADNMSIAAEMGAFKGNTEGNVNPENYITCQETYTVLSRVFCFDWYTLNYENGEKGYVNKPDAAVLDAFSDKASVAGWATDYAAAIVDNGGFGGFGGLIKGDAYITRAEFAYLMNELIGTYIDAPGEYNGADLNADKSIVIRTGGVKLSGLTTDKNLVVAYSVDTTGVTIEDTTVMGVTAIMGAADPVNKKCCISIGGTYMDVRVKSAGIILDASGASMKYYSGVTDSLLNMGIFGA